MKSINYLTMSIVNSRSKANCFLRNTAMDDSIGESYGVTDFSVQ